eukprot:GHVU01027286.1.p2 GENE.GHVU01027286.1~~GHVU01027286.1.p2  ORF type:complete len:130 (-),score=4.85 GHVU01027286.1:158-547(-)
MIVIDWLVGCLIVGSVHRISVDRFYVNVVRRLKHISHVHATPATGAGVHVGSLASSSPSHSLSSSSSLFLSVFSSSSSSHSFSHSFSYSFSYYFPSFLSVNLRVAESCRGGVRFIREALSPVGRSCVRA